MKSCRQFLILLFILPVGFICAQSAKKDSIIFHYDSLSKIKLNKIDSSSQRNNNQIDQTQSRINNLFSPNLNQLITKDKIEKKKQRRGSIQFYKKLDKEKKIAKERIDSVNKIHQPTDKFAQRLDSLNKLKFIFHKRESIALKTDSLKPVNLSVSTYSGKLNSLNRLDSNMQTKQVESNAVDLQNKINQTGGKIDGAVNEKLNLVNNEGGAGANLPANASLPDIQLPSTPISNLSTPGTQLKANNPLGKIDNPLEEQIGKTGIVNEKITESKSIPREQIGKVKSIDELQSAQSKLGEANAITDKAQGYTKDVQNIAKGDMKEVKELPKAAEEQAGKLGMGELQKETGQFDQYKEMNDKLKDPENLKEEAMKQATTVAIDHFVGQAEVVQGAMDKMSKLKGRYSSLNSIKEIPKRKPNEMIGKPFIERLVPGIAFQIQNSGNVLLDYNPLIGYRITGRFTAGAGWIERITIGKRVNISLDDRIYGPRVFADFKIGKGFSVRTDIEKMNTYVPSLTSNGYSTSEGYRAWVWSAFIGIKKEYQFIKKIKGTFQIMYNLYDDHNNSPYSDRLNVRFGLDFPLKKKTKKKKCECI